MAIVIAATCVLIVSIWNHNRQVTFRAKRLPYPASADASTKLDVLDKEGFFPSQFFKTLQLLLCLFVIRALTLKLRVQAAFLRLQNLYLVLRVRELVKRKRKTLTDNV